MGLEPFYKYAFKEVKGIICLRTEPKLSYAQEKAAMDA